jgi:hypothetical protein
MHWEALESGSKWCPGFYVYMKALCIRQSTQDVCKSANEFGKIPSMCMRRFSGKRIPVEAYVSRKVGLGFGV